MTRTRFVKSVIALLIFVITYRAACAQYEAYPPGFTQVLVANGLNYPTASAFAPDGRIFIAEQGGKVRIIKNGRLLAAPFVSVNVYTVAEAGLSGIALDPDFNVNQYVYIYRTVPGIPMHNRISRFTAVGDVALAGSETVILDLDPLNYAEQHNGGAMLFGTDGKLYVGVGDSRNPGNAQNLDTYSGKILRINPDGTVPSGNPFTTGSEQKKRIWSYGLRNPFSITSQPGTGRIFVNDVGEGAWEEINDATASGINFGWPEAEGMSTDTAYANPVFTYDHTESRCAITGGVFFNPVTTAYPASFSGRYFFQDYCTSMIRSLDPAGNLDTISIFGRNLPGLPIGLTLGADGNLYFLSRGTNSLYKIIYTPDSAPKL